MSRRKLILYRVLLAATSVTVTLLLGEAILRLAGFHGRTYLKVEKAVAVEDPVLNWRHAPNSRYYFNRIVYDINSQGFRDHEHADEAEPGVRRIVLVSDSIGYGVNVQVDDNYPRRLENELESRTADDYEVVNLSMPGLSLRQKIHILEAYAPRFAPDLVVVDYCMNDVIGDSVREDAPEDVTKFGLRIPGFVQDVMHSSALLSAGWEALGRLKASALGEGEGEAAEFDYLSYYRDAERLDYVDRNLGRLSEFGRAHEVPLLVPIFPLLYAAEHYRWDLMHEVVQAGCDRHGIPTVDLLPVFAAQDPAGMRVQHGDDIHPSVHGNGLAARTIAAAILDAGADEGERKEAP